MQRLRFETFKQRLLDTFEIEELIDVLKITSEELLDRFEEKVIEYAQKEGWIESTDDEDDQTDET